MDISRSTIDATDARRRDLVVAAARARLVAAAQASNATCSALTTMRRLAGGSFIHLGQRLLSGPHSSAPGQLAPR